MKDGDETDKEITPQYILDADLAGKDFSPFIEILRYKLFGKTKAPFDEPQEALKWLAQYALGTDDKPPLLEKDSKHYINFAEYYFSVSQESPISRLFNEAKSIRDLTGARFSSIVMHILSDTMIFPRKYRWEAKIWSRKVSSRRTFDKVALKLIINEPLTFTEMRKLHRQMRKDFGVTKAKEATSKQLEIYTLVERSGGTPKKGVVSFWREIMHQWNKRHPNDQYTTWKSQRLHMIG